MTSAYGTGGLEFKFWAHQISHTLPTTRYRCNLDVWALAQSHRDRHCSLVTPERVLNENNEDLKFFDDFANDVLERQHDVLKPEDLEFYDKTIYTNLDCICERQNLMLDLLMNSHQTGSVI